ncbi:MAG: ATP-binding protein [Actinomycetota bacterium]
MTRGSLLARLATAHVLVAIVAATILGVAVDRLLQRRVAGQLQDRLLAQAREAQAAIAGLPGEELPAFVDSLGSASSTRITVIRTDGVVLADSEHDPAHMENHANRPEVQHALRGIVGMDERVSRTLGTPFLYVALPARGGLVVRTSLPAVTIAAQRREVRTALLGSCVLLVLGGLFLAAFASRSVARPLRQISDVVSAAGSGTPLPRLEEAGPRELADLARGLNEMSTELSARIADLRHETRLREQVLSSMSAGILLEDAEGSLVYQNAAVANLLGPVDAVPPQVAGTGTLEFAVHHPRRRDLRAMSIRLHEGGRLVILDDVTETKRIEAMRRDFVANASHELKTPVASIQAIAETLQWMAHEDPESARGLMTTLLAETRRLAAIVQDLLDLARLEGAGSLHEPVALAKLIRMEVERLRPDADAKGLGLFTDAEPSILVEGNAHDLSLALRNLLDNAIRYTTRGSVAVRASASGGKATVGVIDTGPGISSRDLPRIFERFFRVDKARSRDKGGTGLGLSIVGHVVEQHGGSVSAESELGVGSRFLITLPLAVTADDEDAQGSEAAPAPARAHATAPEPEVVANPDTASS